MITLEQGTRLISLARSSIESSFSEKKIETLEMKKALNAKEFSKKQGAFVTLYTYPTKALRGCIGLPYPTAKLAQAIIEAARESAFSDPRFMPITEEEYKDIRIEISVLTPPVLIDCKPDELAKNIKVGKDGLIIRYTGFSGLLLPQVPVEENWSAEKFIEQTCQKAGLPRTIWKNKDCHFYKFQAQIFSEDKPRSKVVEKKF